MHLWKFLRIIFLVAGLLSAPAIPALAQKGPDQLKVAIGAPNNWDSGIVAVGQRAGIFKKHGIEPELLFTSGGGETLQAVISGSVDIGISASTSAVFGAFAKGAPVRILLAGTTGASDLYWYVPANSPIKSFNDADGKSVAYSTAGASTHLTALALIKHFNVKARPIAAGASAVTLTQTMSNQLDIGWASPPFGLQQLDEGTIRIVARGSDAPSTRGQTVRVHIVNANVLQQRRDAVNRFVAAYRETYEWLYANPDGVKIYAEYAKVPEKLAVRIRDEFMPKAAMSPDAVSGIDAITADAITYRFMTGPLTAAQLAEVIQIPPAKAPQ